MSMESKIEAAFIALLANVSYIKTNSIPVRAAETAGELGGAMVIIQADELESEGFSDNINWRMTLTAASWVYRPDDGTRSKLDGLHDAVFSALSEPSISTLNLSLSGLEIKGIVWEGVDNGEDQEVRYHARQVKLKIHVEEIPTTT